MGGRSRSGRKDPPKEAEHPLQPPPRGGETAWATVDVTCGCLVKPQGSKQLKALKQSNKSTHRGSWKASNEKPRQPLLQPRPFGRLYILWLLGLHHMMGSTFVASQGLFCNEVSQALVAGTGSAGSVNGVGSSASFNMPRGMATSPDGSFVLITEHGNNKIRKLIVSTGLVRSFAGSGVAGVTNGIGTSARL